MLDNGIKQCVVLKINNNDDDDDDDDKNDHNGNKNNNYNYNISNNVDANDIFNIFLKNCTYAEKLSYAGGSFYS